jgi:hypothetical protein
LEELVTRLLVELGFEEVEATPRTGDGRSSTRWLVNSSPYRNRTSNVRPTKSTSTLSSTCSAALMTTRSS